MEQPKQTEFTADEFIAWALEQPSGRFELDNGIVVAMAPERASHNQAKLNAAIALRGAIGARNLPCRVMTDGMAVRIDDRTVYEPEALAYVERPAPDIGSEFARRSRIVLRGMRGILALRRLLNPFRHPALASALVFTRLVRWLTPVFLVVLLVTNLALLDRPFHRFALAAQGLYYPPVPTFLGATIGGTASTNAKYGTCPLPARFSSVAGMIRRFTSFVPSKIRLMRESR